MFDPCLSFKNTCCLGSLHRFEVYNYLYVNLASSVLLSNLSASSFNGVRTDNALEIMFFTSFFVLFEDNISCY